MVRFKNRYLLVSFIFPASVANPFDPNATAEPTSPPRLNEGGLITLLRESLSVNFGDVGAGEVGGAFSGEFLVSGYCFLGGRPVDVEKKKKVASEKPPKTSMLMVSPQSQSNIFLHIPKYSS